MVNIKTKFLKPALKLSTITGFSAVTLFTGCASIVSDTNYPVTINSTPPDAHFVIKDENGRTISSGNTPMSVTLPAKDGFFDRQSYTIEFNKSGFGQQTYQLNAGLDGWYIGNIIFGGLLGILIVDPLTGAMWSLPEEASVTLTRQLGMTSNTHSVRLLSINELPKEYTDKLEAIPIQQRAPAL